MTISAVARTVLVLVVFTFISACSHSIHRVNEAQYGWNPPEDLTTEKVRDTIERTARTKGWAVSDEKLGSYTAKREWGGGKHNIVVDVTYTGKNFSIEYKDSKLMGYNGTSIHQTYNQFVTQLEGAIGSDVASLGTNVKVEPRPNCKDVGGYDAYMNKTGKTCMI